MLTENLLEETAVDTEREQWEELLLLDAEVARRLGEGRDVLLRRGDPGLDDVGAGGKTKASSLYEFSMVIVRQRDQGRMTLQLRLLRRPTFVPDDGSPGTRSRT